MSHNHKFHIGADFWYFQRRLSNTTFAEAETPSGATFTLNFYHICYTLTTCSQRSVRYATTSSIIFSREIRVILTISMIHITCVVKSGFYRQVWMMFRKHEAVRDRIWNPRFKKLYLELKFKHNVRIFWSRITHSQIGADHVHVVERTSSSVTVIRCIQASTNCNPLHSKVPTCFNCFFLIYSTSKGFIKYAGHRFSIPCVYRFSYCLQLQLQTECRSLPQPCDQHEILICYDDVR